MLSNQRTQNRVRRWPPSTPQESREIFPALKPQIITVRELTFRVTAQTHACSKLHRAKHLRKADSANLCTGNSHAKAYSAKPAHQCNTAANSHAQCLSTRFRDSPGAIHSLQLWEPTWLHSHMRHSHPTTRNGTELSQHPRVVSAVHVHLNQRNAAEHNKSQAATMHLTSGFKRCSPHQGNNAHTLGSCQPLQVHACTTTTHSSRLYQCFTHTHKHTHTRSAQGPPLQPSPDKRRLTHAHRASLAHNRALALRCFSRGEVHRDMPTALALAPVAVLGSRLASAVPHCAHRKTGRPHVLSRFTIHGRSLRMRHA